MSGIVFTSITALILVVVLASPRGPGWLRQADMVLAAAYNEVPFLFMVLTFVTLATMVSNGDVFTPLGYVSLVLAVFILVTLAWIAWAQTRDRPVLRRALDDGLGVGWRDRAAGAGLAQELANLDGGTRWGRAVFAPFSWRPRTVARVANLSYGPAGRSNTLDLYHRRDRPAGAPVLIYLHGGGYHSGTKSRESRELLFRLAVQGWVTISANYRLRPRASFAEHLADAKRVLAWVHEHVTDYGGDADVLVMTGGSAGAHLATICGLSQNDAQWQPGFEAADTSLSAVVGCYGWYGGYYGIGGADSWAGPLGHPAQAAPPTMIIHGRRDPVAAVGDARRLVDHLRAGSSEPVVYAELPAAHHSFDLFHSVRAEAALDAVQAFTAWLRTRASSGITVQNPRS
ncbi:alpha/beta hydrolase [Propionibacteriaceae bacterium G1746]|uniref:alpha/beta hydrolase n=1 Tax=Aestuariimicrobium sp. G57 TaxID=3418485 RepID=UPI003C2347B1